MKQRIIVAAIFLPILFIILFYLPPYIFAGVIALICAISAYELLHALGGLRSNERITIYAVFSSVLIPVGVFLGVGALVFMAVIFALMSFISIEAVAAFGTIRKIQFAQVLTGLFAGAVIPYMLSSLVALRTMPEGHLLVLLPVVSAFVTDAAAYFTGKLIGKKKAFPLVSPKKTVEGCIGGIVAGALAAIVYGVALTFATFHHVVFWALIISGFVGAFATELGDLAFSLVKREYDIKDFGRLLPGHGGMLDRFDSMVFTAPAIYLLTTLTPWLVIR